MSLLIVEKVAEKVTQTGLDRDRLLKNLRQQLNHLQSGDDVAPHQQPLNLQTHSPTTLQTLSTLHLPTTQDEEWRSTDLGDLYRLDWQPAPPAQVTLNAFAPFELPEAQHSRLVLVNGRYCELLSDISGLAAGFYVGNWAGLATDQQEKLAPYLTPNQSDDIFELLNRAGSQDLLVVWAQKNAIAPDPIHLLHLAVADQTPIWIQPRILVVVEEGASLSLVEYYGTNSFNCSDIPQNHPYWVNTSTQIYLAPNAQINHSRIQREAGDAFHIGNTVVIQQQHSRYQTQDIALGAQLSRHNLQVLQRGEQTETQLNGLTAIAQRQTSDTHSEVRLQHPHGKIDQFHKCILDDRAHAIFSGKIFVPKPAQMTQATQLNRSLLMSPKARINTKPELQITADNVKCAHGATVSQLEADELFYLQSRGLTENEARHLLIDAFATDLSDRIPVPSLRHRLVQCLTCRTL
jgi:Fe-S cluster assembly protein SufD